MKYLVTGIAGFIGTQVAKLLLATGNDVVGVDRFEPSDTAALRCHRIGTLSEYANCHILVKDILDTDANLLKYYDINAVIHLAALAGPRQCWGAKFADYVRNNILTTQVLLERATRANVQKFVYASSSSVYGNAKSFPTKETDRLVPASPYGVTKLAGEHLCNLYHENYGVPTLVLRYFTVCGLWPRPDMAHTIFAKAILEDKRIQVFGDGGQERNYTHVADAAKATVMAAENDYIGETFNIGGMETVTMNRLIGMLEGIIGKTARVEYVSSAKGDPRRTCPDMTKASAIMGYTPTGSLDSALRDVVKSVKEFHKL